MNLRQYEIVTDEDKLSVDIQKTCMQYKTIKQWAYVLHDKDDTRPHYHIYLNFGTGVDSKLVSDWFKVPENFINKVRGRKSDILLYLTHENETQKYKHVYDRGEVHSNFDIALEIEQAKIIGDFEHYSYAQQLSYVNGLPIDEKINTFTKLKKLWELHCQTLTLSSDRQLQVVFICGKGGVGKTFYAKKMLTALNFDFCISSSSNDPFQDYMGQKAIILDDLRDKAFINANGSDNLEDLLKILDNNTASSVRSRFSNKVFNGEMIVITSSVPLRYWFPNHRYNDNDSLEQLYRRITVYIEITADTVTVFSEGVSSKGFPQGLGAIYKNELPSVSQRSQCSNLSFVFEKMCSSVTTPSFSKSVQIKIAEDVLSSVNKNNG